MEIKYYLTSEFEEYRDLFEKGINEFIEIILIGLTKEEEIILKEKNISYENFEKDKVKITLVGFINYLIESDNENKGIYIEKTKEYYEFFKEASVMYEESDNIFNLVISKENTRIEVIMSKE